MTTAATIPTSDKAISAPGSAHGPSTRGSLTASLRTLYALTLRQHLRGKRWMVVGGLLLLPVGLAILMRVVAPDVPPRGLEFVLAFMFMPQALLPLVALVYASGIIRDEQEEQTITYLLVRPIPKWAIYAVKLLATMTTAVVLTAVFTALTFAAIYLGAGSQAESVTMRCATATSIHSLAVITYCSLFGLVSLFTRRVLLVGVVYTAIVEGLLANLPFGIRLITVIYYARMIAYRSLSFLVLSPFGSIENFAAEAWQLNVQTDPTLLEHPQLSTCFIVLIVASLVCAVLAAWLCSQREFHVKTPEHA
jgi:ABC-2 type transport system permease protein